MNPAFVSAPVGFALILCTAHAGNPAPPPEDIVPGTISGRVQFLGMHRDFENGLSGSNGTIGAVLGYQSPELGILDFGAAYNHAWTLFEGGDTPILLNDDISVLNEAWLRIGPDAGPVEDLTVTVGRRIVQSEVFREDDYRQKPPFPHPPDRPPATSTALSPKAIS